MNVAEVKKTVDKLVEIGIFGPSRMPVKAKTAPAEEAKDAKDREAKSRPAKLAAPVRHAAAR